MDTYQMIREAIIEKKQVMATYHEHPREMCPHVIGWRGGRAQALFYQFAGTSSSGLGPDGSPGNWRCLFLDELSDVQIRDGAQLAKDGYLVIAEDVVERAIAEAKSQYQKLPGLTLRTGDFFNCPKEDLEAFDAIFDRAMMCACPKTEHAAFVDQCTKRLKKGGLFLTLAFQELNLDAGKEGPPYAISEEELRTLLSRNFEVLYTELRNDGATGVVVKMELLCVARKT